MQNMAKCNPTGCQLADLNLLSLFFMSMDKFSAARLSLFWLPASASEALFPALGSTTAVAEDGLMVCACVAGLWLGGCPRKGAYISKSMSACANLATKLT